jgi:HEAT repeat protein
VARDEPPARSKLVVDALSLARTAASQVALAAIARDPATPSRVRGNAIQYIAHQDAPPAEVVGALAALIDDGDPELRQIARLAYGACARSTRRLAPDRAHAIIRDLLGRLDRAMAASERAELVIAIGNTGAVEALPALRRIIEAGPLRERAQAIAALRFIDDPQVDPLLTRTLLSAPEEAVRLAVIGAVRLRDLGPHASAMAGVARSDPSAGVRRAALALLGDRLVSLPALRSVLEDIQRTDPAAQNRADAARDLGR